MGRRDAITRPIQNLQKSVCSWQGLQAVCDTWRKNMKILINSLLIVLLGLSPVFAAEAKQTSDVTSLYHLAKILGTDASLAEIKATFKKTKGHRVVDSADIINAAKKIGLELQERHLNYDQLLAFRTPVIAHLRTPFDDRNASKMDAAVGHFTVVEYTNKKWVRLFDTPNKFLYQAATVVSRDRFLDLWTGRVLALSEHQRQQRQQALVVSPTLLDLDTLITLQRDLGNDEPVGYQFPVRLKNRDDVPIRIVSVAGNT